MALSEKELAVVTARNALMRAWVGYGLPLLLHGTGKRPPSYVLLLPREELARANPGRWVFHDDGVTASLTIWMECVLCRLSDNAWCAVSAERSWSRDIAPVDSRALILAERKVFRRLKEWGCEHLGPVGRKPPPEVLAIAELELLAGG